MLRGEGPAPGTWEGVPTLRMMGYPPLFFWTGYHPPSGSWCRAGRSVVAPREAVGAGVQQEGGGGLSCAGQGGRGSPPLGSERGADEKNRPETGSQKGYRWKTKSLNSTKNQIEILITMVADILVLVTFDFLFQNKTTME